MELNDETEWDIESIRRYEKLLMFDAEYPVRQMELLGADGCLCCLGDKKSGDTQTSVLTVYCLPPRLKLTNKKASLSPNFDLKILAGTFNKNCITEIASAHNSDCLIASEEGAEELIVYRLNTNESDKLVMSGVLNCEGLTDPRIAATSNLVIASKDSSTRISIIDLTSKSEIGKRKWGDNIANLSPLFISSQIFLIYSADDGSALIFDTRQQQPVDFIRGGNKEVLGWSAGNAYEEGTNSNSDNIAFLSNFGTAKFFDLKQSKTFFSEIELGSSLQQSDKNNSMENISNFKRSSKPKIKLNPLNESIATVGGLDSRIYVIDTKPSCFIVFNHDGHEHMESCLGLDTVTTSHIFYTAGGDKTVISASDNSSINCWSYNIT